MLPSCLRGPVALALFALLAVPYLATVLTQLRQDPVRCCRSGVCCLLLGRGHDPASGHCQHDAAPGATFESCPEQPDQATLDKEARPALVLACRPWTSLAPAGGVVVAAVPRLTEAQNEPPTPPPRRPSSLETAALRAA